MLTITLTLPRSLFTSSTTPVNALNGPSVILHVIADPERHRRRRLRLGAHVHLPQQAPHLVFLERHRALRPSPRSASPRARSAPGSRVSLLNSISTTTYEGNVLRFDVLRFPSFISTTSSVITRIWPKCSIEPGGVNRLLEIRLHLVLVARIGVDHVPLLVAHARSRASRGLAAPEESVLRVSGTAAPPRRSGPGPRCRRRRRRARP